MTDRPADRLPSPGSRLPGVAALPARWAGRAAFTVLDLDLSDPGAFVATLLAWRADPARCARLRYAALLDRPIGRQPLLERLRHCGLPAEDLSCVAAGWPPPLAGVHRLELAAGRVQLTLAIGPARARLPGWLSHADALFVSLDADRAPDPDVLRTAAHRLTQGARIAIAGPGDGLAAAARCRHRDCAVAALEAAGFAAVSLAAEERERSGDPAADAAPPGRARGRDELGPCCLERRHGRAAPDAGTSAQARDAIVIGAGLAGSAVAHALARRGWIVRRLGADDGAAGSFQPVLAQHPSVTPDDAPLSRLLRTATLLARGPFDPGGVLRRHGRIQCLDPETAAAAVGGLPPEWVEAIDVREASERAGVALRSGGLWLPLAASADPLSIREAWTADGVIAVSGPRIDALQAMPQGWRAIDAQGRTVAEAPVAIVACGAADILLHAAEGAPGEPLSSRFGDAGLQRRDGLTTIATFASGPLPRCTVGGDGHAIPIDGRHLLLGPPGALDDGAPGMTDADAGVPARAWRRWTAMLVEAGAPARLAPGRRGIRLSTRDHLPLAGPVPRRPSGAAVARGGGAQVGAEPGLWVTTALGGRGLLWSVLAAESIASALEGEPMPVEARLAALLSPARFLARTTRRGGDTSG